LSRCIPTSGLIYDTVDPTFHDRVDHLLNHAEDIPNRGKDHGVFNAGTDPVAVVDEAWDQRDPAESTTIDNSKIPPEVYEV